MERPFDPRPAAADAAAGGANATIRVARRLASVAGAATLATGVLVLFGWRFDIPALKSVLPGCADMKANTALGFILAGAALTLLGRAWKTRSAWMRWLGGGCAGATALLGLLTLSQHLFAVDLGLDQLLFRQTHSAIMPAAPGRMSPPAALNFFLLGCSLLLAGFHRGARIAQSLALLAGLIGLPALLGYLYGASFPHYFDIYTQMALHTSVAFVLLGLGVVLLRPTEGVMTAITADTIGGLVLRRLAPLGLGVPVVLGWLRIQGEKRGYFDSAFGVALMMVAIMLIMSGVIRWTARAIDRIDEARRQVQSNLRQSEEDLSITLHSIGDAVITTDTAGRVVRMNPVAELLTGWPLVEAAGTPLAEVFCIINARTRQPVADPLAKALAAGEVISLANDTVLIARNGVERQIADSAAPIRDAQGRIRGAVLVFHDVTAEYEVKTALRERVKELTCLQRVRGDLNSGLSVGELCGQILTHLTQAMQFPEIAAPIITLGDQCFSGEKSSERRTHGLHADIHGESGPCGRLSVFYTEDQPFLLPAEQNLIDAIASILGRWLEYRVAEDALHASREFLDKIINCIRDPIFVMDDQHRFVLANDAWSNLHGLAREEVLGRTIEDLFPAETAAVLELRNQRVLDTGDDDFTEEQVPGGQGRVLTVSTKKSLYVGPAGKRHVVGVIRDITDRKNVEKSLRCDEARQRALLELSQKAELSSEEIAKYAMESTIALTGSTIGYVAFASDDETLLTMHYWSKSAMAQCAIIDKPIVYPVNQTGLWGEAVRQRKAVITNDYAAPNPAKRGMPEGHVKLTRHMNIPVFDKGKIVAVAGVGNKRTDYVEADVTQLTLMMEGMWRMVCRKRVEEELQTSKAALERTNENLALATQRARELACQAQQANAAKSEFLANMSHEIRTPMTAILGFAELMGSSIECCTTCPVHQACPTRAENREHVQTICRNGRHLLGLVNDVLDLSKIEAGKLEVEHVPCSIVQIVEEAVSLMRVKAIEKGLSLDARYEFPLLETILSDPAKIRQVLTNLVGNAVKFTPAGGVAVAVRCATDAASRRATVAIDVNDSGIGLTAEQMGRLFQPFAQADSSTTRHYGGTGLGLAISKRLATALEGDIRVVSQPGSGSTFTFTLEAALPDAPRMLNDLADVAARTPHHAQLTPPAPASLHGRLLLAEDGPDNQKLISAILRKAGAEVDVAANGALATDKALAAMSAGTPYAAILMDMQMPEMDGYAATRKLRQSKFAGPIIALTAHAMAGDRQKCLDAGCDDYVAKPVNRLALLGTLARLMGSPAEPGLGDAPDGTSLSPGSPPSDQAIRSAFGDDPDMAGIIAEFVNQLPQRQSEMRQAASNNQWDVLRRLAHQIKGAGGSYGFACLTDAARNLEADAKALDAEAAMLALDGLTHLCGRIQAGQAPKPLLRNASEA